MNIKFIKNLMKNKVDNAKCEEYAEFEYDENRVKLFDSGVDYLGPIKKRKKINADVGFPS